MNTIKKYRNDDNKITKSRKEIIEEMKDQIRQMLYEGYLMLYNDTRL